MEFNRLFNVFTVSAIVIMLLTAFISAGFAVRERAEMNLGNKSTASVSENRTINYLAFY